VRGGAGGRCGGRRRTSPSGAIPSCAAFMPARSGLGGDLVERRAGARAGRGGDRALHERRLGQDDARGALGGDHLDGHLRAHDGASQVHEHEHARRAPPRARSPRTRARRRCRSRRRPSAGARRRPGRRPSAERAPRRPPRARRCATRSRGDHRAAQLSGRGRSARRARWRILDRVHGGDAGRLLDVANGRSPVADARSGALRRSARTARRRRHRDLVLLGLEAVRPRRRSRSRRSRSPAARHERHEVQRRLADPVALLLATARGR